MEWQKGFKLETVNLSERKIDLDDERNRFQPRGSIRGDIRRNSVVPDEVRNPSPSRILKDTEKPGVVNPGIPPIELSARLRNNRRFARIINRIENPVRINNLEGIINTSIEYEKEKYDDKKDRRLAIPWF